MRLPRAAPTMRSKWYAWFRATPTKAFSSIAFLFPRDIAWFPSVDITLLFPCAQRYSLFFLSARYFSFFSHISLRRAEPPLRGLYMDRAGSSSHLRWGISLPDTQSREKYAFTSCLLSVADFPSECIGFHCVTTSSVAQSFRDSFEHASYFPLFSYSLSFRFPSQSSDRGFSLFLSQPQRQISREAEGELQHESTASSLVSLSSHTTTENAEQADCHLHRQTLWTAQKHRKWADRRGSLQESSSPSQRHSRRWHQREEHDSSPGTENGVSRQVGKGGGERALSGRNEACGGRQSTRNEPPAEWEWGQRQAKEMLSAP